MDSRAVDIGALRRLVRLMRRAQVAARVFLALGSQRGDDLGVRASHDLAAATLALSAELGRTETCPPAVYAELHSTLELLTEVAGPLPVPLEGLEDAATHIERLEPVIHLVDLTDGDVDVVAVSRG